MRLAVIALAALVPSSAIAHHGWTSYDESKPVTVTGTLRDVTWTNPHASAKIVRGDQTWVVVLAPIGRMEARGLTKEMLVGAKEVTLSGRHARDQDRADSSS